MDVLARRLSFKKRARYGGVAEHPRKISAIAHDVELGEAGMSQSFTLAETAHGAFGGLATLRIAGQPARRFTRQEAAIVARALYAVARGTSSERQVYMSPIASDQDFEAQVGAHGVLVAYEDCGAALDWAETRALAGALEAFGAGG